MRRRSNQRSRVRVGTSTRIRTSRRLRSARWRERSSTASRRTRIERFRTALCGPLGSVGDRLVWAGWLPFCSLASLAIFGLGASTLAVVAFFLIAYNTGHFALRIWGLETGWTTRSSRRVGARRIRCLRRGPQQIGRLAALATGVAIPLALGRIIGPGRSLLGARARRGRAGIVRDRSPAGSHRRLATVAHRCSPCSSSSR